MNCKCNECDEKDGKHAKWCSHHPLNVASVNRIETGFNNPSFLNQGVDKGPGTRTTSRDPRKKQESDQKKPG
jgi:hypothetical protein